MICAPYINNKLWYLLTDNNGSLSENERKLL